MLALCGVEGGGGGHGEGLVCWAEQELGVRSRGSLGCAAGMRSCVLMCEADREQALGRTGKPPLGWRLPGRGEDPEKHQSGWQGKAFPGNAEHCNDDRNVLFGLQTKT